MDDGEDRAAERVEGPEDEGASGFGEYLRSQRQLARLSLRQLAGLARVSNPYLSQIERGLHKPSIAVVKSLASALDLSADVLLAHAAGIEPDEGTGQAAGSTELAIREDPRLSASQKETMLSVYRSLVDGGNAPPAAASAPTATTRARPRASKRTTAAKAPPKA